jgi:tRNA dimethylallyltransferase
VNTRKINRAPAPEKLFDETEIFAEVEAFLSTAKKPIICISGPTASGKTGLSIRLCKKINGEVINADSRQFYKYMDIGTAKVMEQEMDGVPHHLLDFLKPDQQCTAAQFKDLAEEKIKDILSRKKIPVIIGGTGLFIDVVRKNFSIPRIAPQKKWREEMEKLSDEDLYTKLEKMDEAAAKKIEKKNRVRVIRALEVCETTGEKFSDLQKKSTKKWDDFLIGVWSDPEILNKRIEKRNEIMWHGGFLEEVQKLIDMGFDEKNPAMIAHGYREGMQFLKGEISEEEAREQMIRNTKKYAKRQRTWWRKETEIFWYCPEI